MEQVLEKREIRGVSLEEDTILCEHSDTLYLFLDARGTITLYDSSSSMNKKLPKHDPAINTDIISLSCSSSHTFAIGGFADGSIQLYDLKNAKLSKSAIEILNGPITACSFISDNTVIASNGSEDLYKLQISSGFLGTSISKTKLWSAQTPIVNIYVPSIYVCGETTKCVAPAFKDIALIYNSGFCTLIQIGSNVKIISEEKATANVSAFYLVSQNVLYYTIAERKRLRVFQVDEKHEVSTIYEHEIECDPLFVCFLSAYIVVIVSKNNDVLIAYYTEKLFLNDRLPSSGIIVKGYNEFYHIDKGVLSSFKLVTFKDKFDTLYSEGKFDELITFCKMAKNGEASASIGLPHNLNQRAVIIERAVSRPIEEFLKNRLENKEDPAKVAADFVSLSSSLNMRRLAIERGIAVFDNYDAAQELFKELLNFDKNASFFDYDYRFVERLLRNDIDIPGKANFVLQLPVKIARTEELLKFASESKDYALLAKLFIERCNDYIKALSTYVFANDPEKTCNSIIELFNNKEFDHQKLVHWIFSRNGNEFPRLKFIAQYDNPVVRQVFNYVLESIKPASSAFSIDQFVDVLIYTLMQINTPPNAVVVGFLEDTIIAENIIIQQNRVGFLLRIVFDKNRIDDKKETLLLKLLSSALPVAVQETLVELCNAFKFKKAKRTIFMVMNRFDNIISDVLASNDEEDDVFDFISKNNTPQSKQSIINGITTNAGLLLELNKAKTIDILFTCFKDDIFNIITSVDDHILSMNLLREVFNDERGKGMVIPKQLVDDYFTFLAERYPGEIIKFVKTIELKTSYIDICNKYSAYDACAYIESEMHQYTQAFESLKNFIIVTIVKYNNGVSDEELKDSFEFITSFIDKHCRLRTYELEDYYAFCIRSFAVAFTAKRDHKMLQEAVKKICYSLCDFVPHEVVLQHVISGYSENEVGQVRDILLMIVNDFAFSVQSKECILGIYQDDEKSAHTEYINKCKNGVVVDNVCAKCNSLIGNNGFVVYECGHALHSSCTNSGKCPICFPQADDNPEENEPFEINIECDFMENNNRKTVPEAHGTISVSPVARISLLPTN